MPTPKPVVTKTTNEVDVPSDIPRDDGVMELHLRRASNWKRVSAWSVDGLVLGLFGAGLIRFTLQGAHPFRSSASGLDWLMEVTLQNAWLLASLSIVGVLATFVYLTLGHALMGATFGKRLFGVRVVGRNGKAPTLARSAVRSAIGLTSLAILGLGPLLALFARSGRALHDFLTGTYVVERLPDLSPRS